MKERLSRRNFLKITSLTFLDLVLESCSPNPTPTEIAVPEQKPDPTASPIPTRQAENPTRPFFPSPTFSPTPKPENTPTLPKPTPRPTNQEVVELPIKRVPPKPPPTETPTVVIPSREIKDLRKEFIWQGNPAKPAVALTFDDGWWASQVEAFKNTLKETGVKLTVFPVGRKIDEFPSLWKELYDLGCEFGCHTYTHRFGMDQLSADEILSEIDQSQKALNNALGKNVPFQFFRPVGGAISENIVKALRARSIQGVIWTLSGEGTSPIANPDYVYKRITTLSKNGFIVLEHFIQNDTEALKRVVTELKRENLPPLKLSQIL